MKNSRGQRALILQLLIDARGGWVPLPKIAACAAQYNARIHELRSKGFRIPPPRTEVVNGQRHTWYRLEFNREQTPSIRESASIKAAWPGTFPEFGELAPESRYPD